MNKFTKKVMYIANANTTKNIILTCVKSIILQTMPSVLLIRLETTYYGNTHYLDGKTGSQVSCKCSGCDSFSVEVLFR